MQLKRIGPFSLARLAAGLYGAIGLFLGACFALAALVGMTIAHDASAANPVVGLVFGVGAIVFLPLIYGVLGAVMALVIAALYNFLAGWLGGVELTLE
jgi:uncharacterized membrane protein